MLSAKWNGQTAPLFKWLWGLKRVFEGHNKRPLQPRPPSLGNRLGHLYRQHIITQPQRQRAGFSRPKCTFGNADKPCFSFLCVFSSLFLSSCQKTSVQSFKNYHNNMGWISFWCRLLDIQEKIETELIDIVQVVIILSGSCRRGWRYFIFSIKKRQRCGALVCTSASEQEGPEFGPAGQLGSFYLEFACSPCICISFLRVLQLQTCILA